MNWPTSQDPHSHNVIVPTVAALIVVGILLVMALLWAGPP
jgi:hypothetical protein